jgi:serine phosphatase RsbU (regulator of sigma subunit)
VPDADVQLAQALAARMARAIENARLYASERAARAEIERASDRLRLISRVSELLSESLDYPAVFERLAGLVVEELADLCLIDVLDGSDNLQRVAAVHADPAKQPLADRLRVRYAPRVDGEHPVSRVIRSGVPELSREMPHDFLRTTTRDAEHLRIVSELGFHSFMCAPLSARGRILGTITFVSCRPDRRYDESDLSLALDIARPAAVRIDNARLFYERDNVARSLQQILLPESLPDIPGFELAAFYRPGREGMEVGGDFYDVFLRPDGSFGVAIGDVCGHGPEAAAVMGVARQTIRVAGMNETRPSAILGVLNEVLRRGGYERFVTVCDVRVLPTDGDVRLTVCAAGHPLPLLIGSDGQVGIAGRHGTVLGVVDDVRLTDVPAQIRPGDALVLYTDGLIEWPSHQDVDASFRQTLSSLAGRSAADIADGLQAWWKEGTGGNGRDDAAVVVVRPVRGLEGAVPREQAGS